VALGTSIFSSEWSTHHRGALNSSQTARVKIERTVSGGKWNPTSGDYAGDTTELLYLGQASIDRIARPTRREFVSDSADNQMMQVGLPLDPSLNEADPAPEDLRWQSGDMVTVLVNAASPMLEGEMLFVRGWASDSEDWAYTLHCGFNSKQDGAS
jgi:hypothetical protein